MAKNNETAAAKNNDAPVTHSAPSGYKKSATDAVGFFDGDLKLPIHFFPLSVNLSDSKIEKHKPSCLVLGRLIDPCSAIRAAEKAEGEKEAALIETKKDDVIGVWFSAGMRDLAHKFGVPVYMVQNGVKQIKGKPSPMKVYDVSSPKEGTLIPVREDRRRESAGVPATPFAGVKLAGANVVDKGDASGSDDIPF